MPVQFECSSCGYQATVPDTAVGTELPCPHCQKLLVPLTQDKMENFAAKVLFAAPAEAKEEEIIREEITGPEITFVCPICGDSYQVSKELAGKKISCRTCREPSKVDEPSPRKKKKRRSKSGWPRRFVRFCLWVALLAFLLGFLLGRISKS